jgi:hypothetical protein
MEAGQLRNPLLSWRDDRGDALGGNVVRPPKSVWLYEHWWGDETPIGPPYFTVYQIFDNVFRRILGHLGVSTEKEIEQIETLAIDNGHTFKSARRWKLAVAGGPRAKAVYVFRNTASSESPRLSAHRFGDVEPDWSGGLDAGADVGVAKIGANAKGSFRSKIITAIDPTVKVQVLVPWEKYELSLDAYVREQFEIIGGVETDEAMNVFRDIYEAELPTNIPGGWSFISPPSLTVVPDQPAEFSIEVRAPTPGRALFAVQAEEVENPENVACSELLDLEVTDDLDIFVHYTEPTGEALAGGLA